MKFGIATLVIALSGVCFASSLGDLNKDGIVDYTDFVIFSSQWLILDYNDVITNPPVDMNLIRPIAFSPNVQNEPVWQNISSNEPGLAGYSVIGVTSHGIWSQGGSFLYLHTGYRSYTMGDVKTGAVNPSEPTAQISIDYIWEDDAHNLFLHTRQITGTHNGEHEIQKSSDGGLTWEVILSNYDNGGTRPTLPFGSNITLPRALIVLGNGRMLYCGYTGYWVDKTIYYSSDYGETWAIILKISGNAPGIDPIRHFHGGVFDSEDQILYLFAGDTNPESSILVCSDVDDFVKGEPNWVNTNWRSVWGLNDAARSTMNPNYVLNTNIATSGPNDQTFRAVDLFIEKHPTTGVKYGYWATDNSELILGGAQAYRINLSQFNNDHTKDVLKLGTVIGEGWTWVPVNGNVIMGALGRTAGVGNDDNNAHNYALSYDRTKVIEVIRTPRNDGAVYNPPTLPPAAMAVAAGYFEPLDVVVLAETNLHGTYPGYPYTYSMGRVVPFGMILQSDQIYKNSTKYTFNVSNFITNSMFASYSHGYFTGNWYGAGAIVTQETSIVERNRQYSAKVSSWPGAPYAFLEWWASSDLIQQLIGNNITASAMIYLPADLDPHLVPNMDLECHDSDSHETNSAVFTFKPSDFDGKWHEVAVTTFVAPGCDRIRIYYFVGGAEIRTYSGTIYVSSPRLVKGLVRGGEGIIEQSF
jgi:hypothetical protein